VRWQLFDEDDEPFGECAEIDGLFVDPEPPRRERFTLVDCVPAGGLARAMADGRPTVVEEITAYRDERSACWTLHDPLVIDHRTVEGVLETESCPHSSHGYELHGWRESYGTCRALEGLDRDRPEPPPHPLRLLGFRPSAGTIIRPRRKTFGRVEVQPGGWLLDFDVTDVQPSALGEGLLDVTIEDGVHSPPPRSAEGIWEMWFAGGPDTTNLWAPFDLATRLEWMNAALRMRPYNGADRGSGATYHLDGRYVTDTPGFYCALGEAINGPGGYFGWNERAVIDCCRGGWGAAAPFTLVWHDWQVAASHLPVELPSYQRFDHVELLREAGVTVVLD
jgi:Barstar (barnase inhibitor)